MREEGKSKGRRMGQRWRERREGGIKRYRLDLNALIIELVLFALSPCP